MPIIKSATVPSTGSAVEYHKAMQVHYDVSAGTVSINVGSWTTQDAHDAGSDLVWMWTVDTAPAALTDIDGMLLQIDPFKGGTVVTDGMQNLDAVKLRQWATVKSARDAAIASGFTWDGSKFDSDDQAQQRIVGAVQMAVLAASAATPFQIEWTLFDNTTRVLSGQDMIGVGMALGAFVTSAFAVGVALRAQVDAATSADQVRSITWPAG